jgi:tetratricopeptide (TPR) repeat protein
MELIIKELPRTPTICLNMIVKNESKIITRMFDAVVELLDYYCICDTGSTDDTIQIITEYFAHKQIPGKIIQEPFKNFAYNRNVALHSCKGLTDYVLLLDADMILKINNFDKHSLTLDYYSLFQGNDSFYYENVRLVRNNGLFAYCGVTHEHINKPPGSIGGKVFEKKVLFIHDVGDGGAKSDKFQRDISLLEQGIVDEPGNTRYYFYLGNSYRDHGDHDKAIATYQKQLTMNSWLQEKYCAALSLGDIYNKKKEPENAIKYWLQACNYDHERIEGVVKAMEYYRNAGENGMVSLLYHKHKGYKRGLAEGKLFVEQDKYLDIMEYNNSISAYYINDKDSGYACIKHILINNKIDRSLLKSTLENLVFYKDLIAKESAQFSSALFKIVDILLDSCGMRKTDHAVWQMLAERAGTGVTGTGAGAGTGVTGTGTGVTGTGTGAGTGVTGTGTGLTDTGVTDTGVTDTDTDTGSTGTGTGSTGTSDNILDIESVYQQIKQLRIDGKCSEAMALYKTIPEDHPKYADYLWQLAYEYSIIAYYVGLRTINTQVVTILNNCPDESLCKSVMTNMKFYPDVLKATQTHDLTLSLKHSINDIEYTFNSSSSCILPQDQDQGAGYLLNVRLVNYRIEQEDAYVGCDKHIISLYKSYELTKAFTPSKATLIDVEFEERRYLGIEDVRFYKDDETLLFIGNGYHRTDTVGVVHGIYNNDNKPLKGREIKPAFKTDSQCEKNWVYVKYKGEIHVVYQWFPLKLCKIKDTRTDTSTHDTSTHDTSALLEVVEEKPMPAIFKYARGSSCGTLCNGELWFVVHLVAYEKPRYYYHVLAVFDEQLNLLRYSAPFKFEGVCIEYCIGLIVEKDRLIIPYSTMDRTTKIAVYDKQYIESKLVYI